jgi:3'-phosphoadenosine 5'-phosphosulfate sulfotransferase (PAPS reductase)/FAD synthetase
LEIIYKSPSELKPFQKNPYNHSEKQLSMLKKSMREFGFTSPILISQDNMVIAGHARLKAAQEIGLSKVPTIFIDLPYEKAVAYVIADNQLAKLAEEDRDLLGELLEGALSIPDFDIEAVGFSSEDIDSLFHDLEVHDNMYKTGEGAITKNVTFIEDEDTALTADNEAQEIFSGKNTILVTFSGGKDSTFALIWCKHNFPEKRIIAVFSDTGLEFPGMTAHIWRVCQYLGVELKIVKPDFDPWIYFEEKRKWFNIIHHECQNLLIYKPIDDFYKTFDPSDVVIVDGSRGDQTLRTTRKTKTSGAESNGMQKYSFYHPAFDVDYQIEESIISKSGVPVWEGYSMGFKRSACWCCPSQSSEQAYALSVNYPGLVEVIRRWETHIGSKLQFTNQKGIDDLINYGKKLAEKKKQ